MAEAKRKIIFTRKYEVQDAAAGTDRAQVYKKGRVLSTNERSAAHFVSRGVAEYADEKRS